MSYQVPDKTNRLIHQCHYRFTDFLDIEWLATRHHDPYDTGQFIRQGDCHLATVYDS